MNKNLNVYWNALFVKQQHASGKYICQSAHDDWFIDKDFIKCAVEELKKTVTVLLQLRVSVKSPSQMK